MRCFLIILGLAGPMTFAAGPAMANGPSWSWPLPAPHRVVEAFDPPAEPWLPGQRGVDLAGRAGERVRAAGPGVVAFAGPVAGMPVVSIRHAGGLLTTYEPVRASVRRGQRLTAGEPIGVLVLAGSQCAPTACLHWGLRSGRDYLDPMSLLGRGELRLLPLAGTGSGWPSPAWAGTSLGSGVTLAGGLLALRRRRRRPLAPVVPLDIARRRRTLRPRNHTEM